MPLSELIPDFRKHFPEFSSEIDYPDDQINHYAALAEDEVPNIRCLGELRVRGIELFVAHKLALSHQTMKNSIRSTKKKKSPWNLTPYGKELRMLLHARVMGGVYLLGK